MSRSVVDLIWTAPLAGISDSPFRVINRRFGAKHLYSEMISVEGLHRKHKNTFKLLNILEEDRPLIVQLFGSKPDSFMKAIEVIEVYDYIEEININAGCPVKKVVRNGSGSALMRTPTLLADIVRGSRKATKKKLSVKLRSGWDLSSVNVDECASICENEGADIVAVHSRTAVQMFSGHSDWSLIKKVKEKVKIPVIGNGDVTSLDEAKKMISETGCDGVMVGRALVGNPWFFTGHSKIVDEEYLKTVLDHIELAKKFYGETAGYKMMKKHLIYYAKNLDSSIPVERRSYYASIGNTRSSDEQVELVRTFFENIISLGK
jgi:tRNA-dihydrouridine synthase B